MCASAYVVTVVRSPSWRAGRATTVGWMDPFPDASRPEDPLPLVDRVPDYLATFSVGLAASTGVGLIVWLISDVSLASSVGYTIILYGIVLLLAGGASGGGYTNLGVGAVGAMFGTRRTDEAQAELEESWQRSKRMDSQERLRRGLRPEANPRAFWQVIGGGLYVAVGLVIVIIWS